MPGRFVKYSIWLFKSCFQPECWFWEFSLPSSLKIEPHISYLSGLALATSEKQHKSHLQASGILPPILLPYFKTCFFSLGLKLLWVWNIPQADRVAAGRQRCLEPLPSPALTCHVSTGISWTMKKKKNEGQKRQRNWVKVISHHNDFCKWVGRWFFSALFILQYFFQLYFSSRNVHYINIKNSQVKDEKKKKTKPRREEASVVQ